MAQSNIRTLNEVRQELNHILSRIDWTIAELGHVPPHIELANAKEYLTSLATRIDNIIVRY